MVRATPDVVICFLLTSTIAVIYVLTQVVRFIFDDSIAAIPGSKPLLSNDLQENWVFRLSLNLLGYSTILLPGYLIFQYVKKSKYLEKAGGGCLASVVKQCFASREVDRNQDIHGSAQQSRSSFGEAVLLLFCFIGLQASYLTWGILQEKIMTKEYTDSNGVKGHFKDSQFLVFVNRILAFALAGIYLTITGQTRHSAPLYKFVFCSFSNILSSWCQYEALKYVSFPTQVLTKASKIIPVMIMGKVVSRAKYEYYEYITALLISLGMGLFLWGAGPEAHGDKVSTLSGLFLLAVYLAADSFTSNWQGAIFQQYRVSSVQSMCGVNLFSCLFTAVSLFQQGGFGPSLAFMTQFYQFTFDCLMLSICSAAGQLFIFYTIYNFGAVTFAIIMTIRQGLAILLSCIIYNHHITAIGVIGVVIVFLAVFLRMYCNQRLKSIHRKRTVSSVPSKV